MSGEIQETYVEVLYPGILFPEETCVKVSERDPKAIAAKHPNAFCLQFYDLVSKQITVDGEKQWASGKRKNLSPKYYPGATVMTVSDIKKLKDQDYRILISNMEGNGWSKVVKCRTGNFQPFEAGDEII